MEDLRAESHGQKNCTEAHFQQICDGVCYFFKTTESAPQRLTIRIEREDRTEAWIITDIRAYDNAKPIRAIIQWTVNQLRVPASLAYWPNDAWYLPPGQKYSFVPSAPPWSSSSLAGQPSICTKDKLKV
jgi:hypothetical protein